MMKIKEFINAFRKFIKDLSKETINLIIFCICMGLISIIIILSILKDQLSVSERKYLIRDVSGATYCVNKYVKESDGTIKIECNGNVYILNGYTIIIFNDEKK